jgi:hypothetical protein
MKKMSIQLISTIIVSLLTFNLFASDDENIVIKKERIYLGAGVGVNSLSGSSNSLGLQLFGGYIIPANLGDNRLSVEVGYMDTGNFGNGGGSAKGLWTAAVFDMPLKNDLSLLGRAGLDLGDDDGVMLGVGFGLKLNQKVRLRAEYVIRDNIDSLQLNAVLRL